jgi:hypothetical protein
MERFQVSSANWWARKLGTPAPATAPQQPTYTTPPARAVSPTLQPFQAPSTPPAVVTEDNIADAAALWQGGQGTKTETTHCPNCGSPNYFSRANQGFQNPNHTGAGASVTTERGTAQVAARCFACNYTGAAAHPSLQ